MRYLPQEIIDAIVDHFATSDESQLRTGNEPREADTLRACALTARAFRPRSQRHLFTSIKCSTTDSDKLEALVSGSQHLIASYVAYFSIISCADSTGLVDFTVVSRILGLFENLRYLEVSDLRWVSQRAIFENAFREALLLPSFRSLSFISCTFADVLELESLLSHASGLKALSLEDVFFDNTDARRVDPISYEPPNRIILDSLEVGDIKGMHGAVEAMLSSFTVLDIKHLRSLDVDLWTPLIPLLKANAQTVQTVRYFLPDPEDSDPHILENNTSLCHIEIAQRSTDMANSLRVFGDLGHLMALQTVSLRFYTHPDDPPDQMTKESWADLDKVLAQAHNTLEDVHIYMHNRKNVHGLRADLALLRGYLPSVAGKISVYEIKEEDEAEDSDSDD